MGNPFSSIYSHEKNMHKKIEGINENSNGYFLLLLLLLLLLLFFILFYFIQIHQQPIKSSKEVIYKAQ